MTRIIHQPPLDENYNHDTKNNVNFGKIWMKCEFKVPAINLENKFTNLKMVQLPGSTV